MTEVKGTVSPALRSLKGLSGTFQRDYAYDVYWVVFPLYGANGEALFPDSASEAELLVSISNKQGKVVWPIPESIRNRKPAATTGSEPRYRKDG
jgi:hypothetical protein